jgi:TrmH family RNA methyltransferase
MTSTTSEPITSAANPRLRALRKLARKRERERRGCFVAEGEDLIAAAVRAGVRAVEGYRLAGCDLGYLRGLSGVGGVGGVGGLGNGGADGFREVSADALAACSTLGSSTRVIGVYEQRWVAPRGPLCVYLHGVSDPGNVGTVLRSAEAFGAACVALGPGCADAHSPKAVRASMGAIFTVALARVDDVAELPGERVALVPGASDVLQRRAVSAERACTVLVGAERDGLPDALVRSCDRSVRIPIASQSLNAAMAATVALYELTRDEAPASRSSRVRAS